MARLTIITKGGFCNARYQDITYAPLSGKWYIAYSSEGNTYSPWKVEKGFNEIVEFVKELTGRDRGPKSWLKRAKKENLCVSLFNECEETAPYVETEFLPSEEDAWHPQDFKELGEAPYPFASLILDDSWNDATGIARSIREYRYERETDTWNFAGGYDDNTRYTEVRDIGEGKVIEALLIRGVKMTYIKDIINAVKNGNSITLTLGKDY